MLEKYVARAIIWNERDEVLLGRRASGYLGGKWEVPGGLVEPGEHSSDTVVREVEEELGLVFEAKRYFKTDIHQPPESQFLWHIDYYVGTATGELDLDPQEVSEATYAPRANLRNYEFTYPRVRRIITASFRLHTTQPQVIDLAPRARRTQLGIYLGNQSA